MKKFIGIVIAAIAMLLITGVCAYATFTREPENKSPEGLKTNMIIYHDTMNNGCEYMIDANTGVVYLGVRGYKSYAVTVMMNADGSVMTADQLGLEINQKSN